MATDQSLGAAVSAGWKGAVVRLAVKRAAVFAPGFFAMLRAAVMVSVGEVLLGPVAFEKSEEQPAVPSELTQVTRRLARLLISARGTTPLPAAFWLSAAPDPRSERLLMVRKALAIPWSAPGVAAELMCVASVMKPERA